MQHKSFWLFEQVPESVIEKSKGVTIDIFESFCLLKQVPESIIENTGALIPILPITTWNCPRPNKEAHHSRPSEEMKRCNTNHSGYLNKYMYPSFLRSCPSQVMPRNNACFRQS